MLFFNSILYLIWKGEVVDKKFIQNREIIIDKFSSYKEKKNEMFFFNPPLHKVTRENKQKLHKIKFSCQK